MKKTITIHACLVFISAIILIGLFYLPYWSVRQKTIDAFNSEHMVQIDQATREIQEFFNTYGKALRFFASQQSIIHLDRSGRLLMDDFLAIHSANISAVTRISADSKIIYSANQSYDYVGVDLSSQSHNKQIMENHQLIISDAFISVQGEKSIAFAYPVFDGEQYAGSINFLFPFTRISRNKLADLNSSEQFFTILTNNRGTILSSSVSQLHGHNFKAKFAHHSDISQLAFKMEHGGRGNMSFSTAITMDEKESNGIHYAVYAPVRLAGNNFWSLAIISPENNVLAAMRGFRNQWFLATTTILGVFLLLGWFLQRAIAKGREEQKQQAMEKQLAYLLDFIPLGTVVFDKNGFISYVNKAVLKLLELKNPDEIINRNVFDFVHDDYRSFTLGRMNNLLAGRTNETAIIKIISPAGEVKDVEQNSFPFIFTGQSRFLLVLRDVTEELKKDAAQRRLVTAIEQAKELIVITDRDGTIEYVNPEFTRVTGYRREEVLGQNPQILNSGEQNEDFYQELWETIVSGHNWTGRIINRKKSGELYTETAAISPVRDITGYITHFVAVMRDITHEVKLETQLRQSQKMEAIGTLAGGIAHDFNNILGAILGFTDIALLKCDIKSPIHEFLLNIRKGGKRAADLIQQILTFSRQTTTDKKPIEITAIIQESIQLLRASFPSTISINLIINTEKSWVLANSTQLQQIIINLCTNGFHAMQEQGGKLTIQLDKPEMDESLENETGTIKLSIRDTGVGMGSETLTRIFEPFYTTKEPGVGTGMGLSVVHGLIRELGGKINVYSSPGIGTSFTVLLPTVKAEVTETIEDTSLPRGTEHILVVDDEEDILTTTRMMLTHLGYKVKTCNDPLEAMEKFKTGKYHCDLVITDQTMPSLTGLELAQRIKKISPQLPIVIATGYSDKINEDRIKEVEAAGLLLKPVALRDLAVMIHRVLSESGQK
jgi:PAS domain S-box-containing protein